MITSVLKLVTQIFLQYTIQQKRLVETAPEKIKGMSVQAGLYFVGLCFFLVMSLASLIEVFIDLGHQWDLNIGTHFSGPILAAVLQFALGLVVFGGLVLLARYLARKKPETPADESGPKPPGPASNSELNPLMIFGEEFLSQLLTKLK